MRSILNNNNGYILAFVLIISILIPVLFLSFITISSNTTKQNEVVESTIQSQSIAEMGATYFQTAMTNEIETKKTNIINNVKAIRAADIAKGTELDDNYYIGLAIVEMQSNLQEVIASLNTNREIDQNMSYSFNISPTSGSSYFSATADKLNIEFTSTGHDKLKQAKINGTIKIDFSKIFPPGTGGSTIFQYNSIADPGTSLKTCTKVDLTEESCQIHGSISYHQNEKLTFNKSIYRVSGAFDAPNLNNNIDDSTLYILGSMTADNLNSINKLKLHVGGALNVGHFNGSGLVDSTIEVGGAAAMGNIKLTRTTMYIDGNPKTTIGNINGMADSIIYINSKAEIKGADLNKNAKICVNGDLKIGNINNNSDGTSGIYAISSDNPKVNTNPVAFSAACAGGGSTVTPSDIDYIPDYDYSY